MPAPFDTLTTFSSQVLFAFPRDQSDLSWGVFSKLRLRSQHSFGSRVVQQFCKRHHAIASACQFSFALFVDMCSFGEHPWRTPNIFKGKHFRMESVAFSCQSKTSPSIATVKFVKQYFLFFFKLHDQEKIFGTSNFDKFISLAVRRPGLQKALRKIL